MRNTLLLLIIVLSSCIKDRKKELTYFLTNDSCKYWDMVYNPSFYDKSKSKTFPYFCYSFDKSKNWYFYSYDKGKRKPYEQHDIVITQRWSLISDTSIMLGGKMYKIEKLTKDTFIYASDKTDSTVLVKSLYK